MSALQNIPIENIRHRKDARLRSDDSVSALSESIAEIGLLQAIRVRQVDPGYEVILGSHRLQACELLGWREIRCEVVDDDDLHAELAMIDENLFRAELSPSERATQTARRKAIYETLYPQSKHGENLGNARVANLATREIDRFTTATAKATGQSERTVRRDAERGEKIVPEAMQIVSHTRADTGAVLNRLKSLPADRQMQAAKDELAKTEALRQVGGIAGRYSGAAVAVVPDADIFVRFVKLVDELESLPVASVISGAGRQRAVLGQRASGLAEHMGTILEGIDQ